MMGSLAQLQACSDELAAAVKTVVNGCWNAENLSADVNGGGYDCSRPLVPTDATPDVHRARQTIIAKASRLQVLLGGPVDFLQQLSKQSQLLACLQWLGEFQVLACIPLNGSVPCKDISDLAGVPERQLSRVIRIMATAGFLCEPQPKHVAHTPLSASFVTKPSLLDAAMFLSEIVNPAALHMGAATQRFGDSQEPSESGYNVAFATSATFASACKQQPKLQRQWPAYLQYGMGDSDEGVVDALRHFDWLSVGSASVVEVGARSTATSMALANLYPGLHFIVQLSKPGAVSRMVHQQSACTSESLATPVSLSRSSSAPSSNASGGIHQHFSSRVSIQQRTPGTPQPIQDAAVYILRMQSPPPGDPPHSAQARIVSELSAHLYALRHSGARLILVPQLLPEPGTVDPDVEAMVYVRDLSMFELANEQTMEMQALMDTLNSMRDNMGQLVVVNKLRSRNNAVVALEVRYQAYTARREP